MELRYHSVICCHVCCCCRALFSLHCCPHMAAFRLVFCFKQVCSLIYSRLCLPCMDVGSVQEFFYFAGIFVAQIKLLHLFISVSSVGIVHNSPTVRILHFMKNSPQDLQSANIRSFGPKVCQRCSVTVAPGPGTAIRTV